MKEPHDHSRAGVEPIQEKRRIRWGWWGRGTLWTALFIFFLLVFFFHDVQDVGLPTIVSVLLPSSPPATIVARNDLSEFTLLTSEKIEIVQGSQERKPSQQDTAALKKLEEAFYQHITLRPYSKGEEIQLSDLGPKLLAIHTYQIREIRTSTSLAWIQVGDTLTFTLFNTLCASDKNVPNRSAAICAQQSNGSPLLLKDVVIVRMGKTGQDGLVALLVVIPLEENTDSVASLNLGGGTIVAYPLDTITDVASA